ncbi:MAG: type II secretion system F family protein [Acidimicrobiales bacterium]
MGPALMRRRGFGAAFGAVLALAAVTVPAALPAAAQAPGDLAVTAVDVSGLPRVTATVAVPAALAGEQLSPRSFTVTEGGRPVTVAVTPVPAGQLEVILVIDTSGSMAGRPLAAAKKSAAAFLATIPAGTRIAVVGFGATPLLAGGFSLDRSALASAVDALVAEGETALYDALTMAASQFSAAPGVARSIVLLSDGGDTASRVSLGEAMSALGDGRVHVDAVELTSSEGNTAALSQLASVGGGQVFPAGNPSSLEAIYRSIAGTLGNQYRLSYRSGGPGELRIALDHEGVTADAVAVVEVPPGGAPAPAPATPAPATPAGDPRAAGKPIVSDDVRLGIGLAASFVVLCLVGVVIFQPRRKPKRRVSWGGMLAARRSATPSAITGLADRAGQVADAALDRRGRRGRLNTALERAGIALRPSEYLVLCGCGALCAALIGLLVSGPLAALACAALVVAAGRGVLGRIARRRQARFAGQLSDTLQLMSGTLRAGYGLLQALDAMAREAPSPTSDEFRRIVVESRLGRDLSESLRAMSERMACQDFQWVVEAIEINREVGGDLAEVLDRVGATIRERDFLRRQVKALSAEGRLSGYVLMALPVFLSFMIRMRNPSYFNELTHGVGILMSGIGLVLLVVGGLWIRKVCRLVL